MSKPAVSPYLAILIGVLAVSTAALFIRYAQAEVPSTVIAAYRLGLATLLLVPFTLRRFWKDLVGLSRRDLTTMIIAGIFLAFHFASWIQSLKLTSVASSVVLVTTTPLWVAILSPLILKEPVSRRAGFGLIISLIGSIFVGLSDNCTFNQSGLSCAPLDEWLQGSGLLGNFLALFGAWMAAGYFMAGRALRFRLPLAAYVFGVYCIAAILLVSMALVSGQSLTGYSLRSYLWLLLLALVPQLIGHSILNWSLAYLPASFVAVSLLGEPVGSSILAFFLLNETPGTTKLIGAILILTGIVVSTHVGSAPATVIPPEDSSAASTSADGT